MSDLKRPLGVYFICTSLIVCGILIFLVTEALYRVNLKPGIETLTRVVGICEMFVGLFCFFHVPIWKYAIIFVIIGAIIGICFGNYVFGLTIIFLSIVAVWCLIQKNTKEWYFEA